MDQESEGMAPISRRALAVVSGGLAMFGLGSLSTDAKKKKKKKKKKCKPYAVEVVQMNGANEVPAVNTPLLGMVEFQVKAKKGSKCEICSNFSVSEEPTSPVIGAHIHKEFAGVNGPIVVDFDGVAPKCVNIELGLAKAIKENPAGFYANVHTGNFPDGEIRGQLTTKV